MKDTGLFENNRFPR